jgi:hypothetical protein
MQRGDRLVAKRSVGRRGRHVGPGVAAELRLDELAEVGGDGETATQGELAERLPRFRGNAYASELRHATRLHVCTLCKCGRLLSPCRFRRDGGLNDLVEADEVRTWQEAALAALRAEPRSWLALPSRELLPEELLGAIERFDAGPHPAAVAAAEWLRTIALDSTSARTWVLVGSGVVLAYCALASDSVPLTRRQRAEVGSAYRETPATLVGWAAKAADADVDGRVIISYAVSIALEVRQWQATCVLALDPFDEDVRRLWMDRYGFREVAPPLGAAREPPRRLWINLEVPG